VKITIKNFQKKIPINPIRIKKTILKVLSKEDASPVRNTKSSTRRNKISNGARKSGEITICFVNDKKIKELNAKFLHKNSPTDVLVFDMQTSADIIISTDTAVRNSRIFKTTRFYELHLYLVHGLLHLLGYDHSNPRQRQLMRQKEKEYVNT
jgi:probable rRNA maturation factor